MDADKMQKVKWVKSKLVVEIAFNEWTPDKHLRHAEFKTFRPDKTIKQVNAYDASKKINGRKCHLLVDTLGLVLGVAVTPASTTERDGAQPLLKQVLEWFTWMCILWVDGGYPAQSSPVD